MVDEEFLRYGGRQKHIYHLSRELLNRGHHVTIFSPNGSYRWPDVKVKTFKELKIPNIIDSKIIPGYRTAVKDYDIVHSHDTLFSAFLVKHAKHFFVTTHGLRCSLNCGYSYVGKLFHKVITDRNLKAANEKGSIFCVSDYDLYLCRKLGLKNSIYIPNGVDIQAIKSANGNSFRKKYHIDGEMILEVGRLSPVKGQLRFSRDCGKLIKREINAHFVFIGARDDEDYVRKLKNEARRIGIKALVLPDLPDKEVYQAYKACDVFVLPSEFEGQPISILEAFAAGKPVVATDVGGIRKCVGSSARLVPFWKPKRFAQEVINLLKNETLRTALEKRAIQHVRKFSWTKVADTVEQKYLESVDQKLK